MTKPTNSDRSESARKIFNAQGSTFAELEAAEAVVVHALAETADEIEALGQRRQTILASDAPAAEIDKQLERHDEAMRALKRKSEVATALSEKLATRISMDREAERAAKQQTAYDEALKLHVTATSLVRDFLDRVGREVRTVMHTYATSEMRTAAANLNLPPCALPIPSIEAERMGKQKAPKTNVRHFRAFVHAMRRIAEEGCVKAEMEKDGRWGVFIPGGSTGGGQQIVCDLVDFVEVTEEKDATPWPENLAEGLSVPSFYATERSGWKSLESPASPNSIASALQSLESQPSHHFPPRIETRVMRLAAWRELNGEVADAELAPAAVAAE